MPNEFKEHELVKPHGKPGDFVKWAIDSKTESDALKEQFDNFKSNSIAKLPEKATDEERSAYLAEIGVPENPDGYEFKGEDLDANFIKEARNAFHASGTPKSTAEALVQWFVGYQKKVVEDYENQRKEEAKTAVDGLKKEFGDKYEESTELARRFMKNQFGDDFYSLLESVEIDGLKLGNHPTMLKAFLNISKRTGEDTSPSGKPPAGKNAKPGIVYDKSPEPPVKSDTSY